MEQTTETFGAVKSPYDIRDYKLIIPPDQHFPTEFELPTVPVKNQFSSGTCVAFSSSSVVEYHHRRQHGEYLPFSTEFIYGVRESGYYFGDGMHIRDALHTLVKYGDVPLENLRGNNDYKVARNNVKERMETLKPLAHPHRISSYFRLYTTDEIKSALLQYGYVLVNMKWYKDAKLNNGVYTYSKNDVRSNHAVLIYGWNEQGWLAQNSWGSSWGNDGRFIIPFDFKFNECWGTSDDIVDGYISKPKRNKFIDIFYNIINTVINFFTSII